MPEASPVDSALQLLGKRLLLQMHDSILPGSPDDDIGRGTPYSANGYAFTAFVRSLGFTGIQFGPQGQTSSDNPSPYDSTAFSRSRLSLSFAALARDPGWGALVDRTEAAAARSASQTAGTTASRVTRTEYGRAFALQDRLCSRLYARFESQRAQRDDLVRDLHDFIARNDWVVADALYEALSVDYGTTEWWKWSGPDALLDRRLYAVDSPPVVQRRTELAERYRDRIEAYALVQLIVHSQHAAFHDHARSLGLELFADLQVGLEHRDRWRLQSLFLDGYLLGAPPSRTNAEGQPWGYPVLDPSKLTGHANGTVTHDAIAYFRARVRKLFAEFDGVRIDHPQGIVCPWVYRATDVDPFHAVQTGARLYSSPSLPDHPELARYAIAHADQLSGGHRYADAWVTELDEDQIERYARLVDVIVEEADRRGLDRRAIACETLSTQPYPLRRVMERHGLGRFRVTQKMNPNDPNDVYRTDRAGPDDWAMLGNHDTPSIWELASTWSGTPAATTHAAYLANRLAPEGARETMRRALESDTGELVHAMFADCLVSRARNVMVFFADLFGVEERYNLPGSVGPHNWSLRLKHDYASRYAKDAGSRRALDLAYACLLAIRSPLAPAHDRALEAALERAVRHASA